MNEIVYMKNDEAVCDSLQVAEKFEKRHDRVLRAIDNLLGTLPKNGETSKMFILSKRKADDGQFHRMYLMNRDGFSLLVMGFTGKKRIKETDILRLASALDVDVSVLLKTEADSKQSDEASDKQREKERPDVRAFVKLLKIEDGYAVCDVRFKVVKPDEEQEVTDH